MFLKESVESYSVSKVEAEWLAGVVSKQKAGPLDIWPFPLRESQEPTGPSGSVPTHTGLRWGPVLTSLVERLLWASRLRMASVLMALYGKKRSLTCREGWVWCQGRAVKTSLCSTRT